MPTSSRLLMFLGQLVAGCAALAWVFSFAGDAEAFLAVAVLALTLIVSRYLQVVVHELGHLLAALCLRIPVNGMRILGTPVRGTTRANAARSHVELDIASASPRALRLRWLLVALAGPAANLLTAGVTYPFAADPGLPVPVRAALVGVVVAGAKVGVLNLLPVRSATGHSDGRRIVVDILRGQQWRGRVADLRSVRALGTGAVGDLDPDQLRDQLARARAPVAGVAGMRLAALCQRRGPDALLAEVPTLIAGGTRSDLAAGHVVRFTSLPALELGLAEMRRSLEQGREPAAGDVAPIAALAEAGFAAWSEAALARIALALARLLQDRPDEVRRLLAGPAGTAANATTRAIAYALRALAELELGDVDAAGRLLAAAQRHKSDHVLVRIAALGVSHRQHRQQPDEAPT